MAPRTGRVGIVAVLTVATTLTIGGVTTAAGASGFTHDQAFVAASYRDFVDRMPTADEVGAAAVDSLGSSTARSPLVTALAHAPESVRAKVVQLYQDALGRPGDDAGVSYWVGRVIAGRLDLAQVAASLYASQESFDRDGGTVSAWVSTLYATILGRPATSDPDGVAYWTRTTERVGRFRVALAFRRSTESSRDLVEALYNALLGRTPDDVGWAYWAAKVAGGDEIVLAEALAESAEYYDRAWTRFGPSQAGAGSLSDVTSVASSWGTACAVAGDRGYCWGYNANGQVGNGDTMGAPVRRPYELPLGGVTDISVSPGSTCAIASGRGYCWGDDSTGSIGDLQGSASAFSPYELPLADVTSLVTSGKTTCAIAGGTGYCFGAAALSGADRSIVDDQARFASYALPLGNVTSVAVDQDESKACAIANGGAAYCWSGGDVAPTAIAGLIDVTSISASYGAACAVAVGNAYCWGDNSRGQVGNGDASGASVTTPFALPLHDVTSITTNWGTTCAVADGRAWCWGHNVDGSIGNGGVGSLTVTTPYELPMVGVTSVSPMVGYTCAVAQGIGYCWGFNGYGNVGIGSTDDPVLSPTQLPLVDVIDISTGFGACATADGAAYCWGDNSDGSVGNGDPTGANVQSPYQL